MCIHLFQVRLHSQIFHFSSAEPQLLADNADVWISKTEITPFCHKPEEWAPRGPRPLQDLKPSGLLKHQSNKFVLLLFEFTFVKTSNLNPSPRGRRTHLRTFSLCSDQLFLGFGVTAATGSCAGTHSLQKKTANKNIHGLETQESERREAGRWMASAQLQSRAY